MVKLDLDELKLVEEPDDESPIEMNYRLDKSILELCRDACELLTEVQTNFVDKSDRVAEQRIRNARTSIKEFREWSETVLESERAKFIV